MAMFWVIAIAIAAVIFILHQHLTDETPIPSTSSSLSKEQKKYLIPQKIFMTQKYDICNVTIPSYLQQDLAKQDPNYMALMLNVQRIKAYNPEFEVICFDDESAYNYLKEKNESFAEYFKNEKKGAYKADIFRIVLLYYEGGWYFDSDMEPTMPLKNILNQETTFTSVISGNVVFQSYLGATAFNEILRLNLEIFDHYYSNKLPIPYNVGTVFLSEAIRMFTDEWFLTAVQKKKVYGDQVIQLFEEKPYDGEDAANLILQRSKHSPENMRETVSHCVYDEATGLYPFWSRISSYQREW